MIDREAEKIDYSLRQTLDQERQQQLGITHYTWSTAGDDKVRPSHAANEGATFSWDNPPATGHPGAAPNCRCFPYPALVDDQGVEQLRRPGPGSDGRAESLYPEQYLIPAITRLKPRLFARPHRRARCSFGQSRLRAADPQYGVRYSRPSIQCQ